MADNTRMATMAVEIRAHDAELKRVMDLLELRDQEQHAHTAQVEAAANAHIERIQSMVESLLQNQAQLHGGSSMNSTQTHTIQPRQAFQIRNVKLDFPKFNGSDVMAWIFKAEQFFDYYGTADEDRLTIAAIHMEEDVVPWFQMIQRTNPFMSWTALTTALETEFGPSPFDCPQATLFKFQQKRSVSEYYLQLMSLANRSGSLPQEALLTCFVSGLHTELQRDVIAQSPPSLLRVVVFAKLYEDRYNTNTKPHSSNTIARIFNPKPNYYNTHYSRPAPSKSPLHPLLPTPSTKPIYNPNQIKKKNSLLERCNLEEKRANVIHVMKNSHSTINVPTDI